MKHMLNKNLGMLVKKNQKDIKEINKGLVKYKYIKNLVITNEPMVKTTTAKVKRFEEMKKMDK